MPKSKNIFEMKQPELGKAIADLRLSKGLTQEELVEKCNISVRTIQRIEAGEVTPRSYTIKNIFSALDYDYQQFINVESTNRKIPSRIVNGLMVGFISGIIYFLVGIPEGLLEAARMTSSIVSQESTIVLRSAIFGDDVYIIIKVIATLSFLGFMYGFYQIGKFYKSGLVIFSALIYAIIVFFTSIANVSTLYTDLFSDAGLMLLEILFFSVAGVIFGVGLVGLRKQIGDIALIAGIMEIVVAICLITFIFSLLSLIIYIPTLIVHLVLLQQVRKKLVVEEHQ